MVILSLAMIPGKETSHLSKVLGINKDTKGFFLTQNRNIGSVETTKSGIFVAGCAEGPKDVQNSIIQAEASVGKVINCLQ